MSNANFAFAVHILTLLSSSEEPLSSAFIAASLNTNPVTVRRLTGVLREGRLVETTQGSQGGARLRRKPQDITLGDVYTAVKAEEYPFGLHPAAPSPECPIGCNIHKVLVKVFEETDRVIIRALMKLSIQDILDEVLEPTQDLRS